MILIKLKFRPSTVEGEAGSLSYRVIYKRRVRQVATDFRAVRGEWDSETEDVIINDKDTSRANYLYDVRRRIECDKQCFGRIIKKLNLTDALFTVDTVAKEFQKQSSEITLFSYMENLAGRLWRQGQHRTSETYKATLNSFRKFRLNVIKDSAGNTRKQYHNALTLINRNLKDIGRAMGLALPLTMYVARHSWASIARDEGIPLSVISEGMGHDSVNTTQIYLASLEIRVIDDANRKILRLL